MSCNGDGLGDIVVGGAMAYGYSDQPFTYVIFGQSDEFPAEVPLAQLDGSDGFVALFRPAFFDSPGPSGTTTLCDEVRAE